jgi:CheY-like chemotaxis protein
MSKIESGKFLIASDDFSLHDAMGEVARLIAPRCDEKDILFVRNFSDLPRCSVVGDKLRLKQVLINLLGNAVKFTPEDGRIDFLASALNETDTRIEVSFSVKDSGIGMTDEQASKVFSAFEQANSSIAVRFGGTGLGLAISQNLIMLMGGLITVSSKLGEGSVFSFTLSLDKSCCGVDCAAQSGMSIPDLSGKRILLVEDIEINRVILVELLDDTCVEIDEVGDGVEAVASFESHPEGYYDLVFMDVQMPNMDGYEATRRIRMIDRPDAKSTPILAMTANAYREDIERAKEAGMNGHLAKPLNVDDVMLALTKWLK